MQGEKDTPTSKTPSEKSSPAATTPPIRKQDTYVATSPLGDEASAENLSPHENVDTVDLDGNIRMTATTISQRNLLNSEASSSNTTIPHRRRKSSSNSTSKINTNDQTNAVVASTTANHHHHHSSEDGLATKTNRPRETAWTQQRLETWKPLLTLRTAIITLFITGFIFIILGLSIITISQELDVIKVVYDSTEPTEDPALQNCRLDNPEDANSFSSSKTCFVNMTLSSDISAPAIVFYELTNYYQSHRRYERSKSVDQFIDAYDVPSLEDDDVTNTLTESCVPRLSQEVSQTCVGSTCTATSGERELFPCGIIANTMFNDIFWLDSGVLPSDDDTTTSTTTLGRDDFIHTGIARDFIHNEIKNPTGDNLEAISNITRFLPIWNNPNLSRIIPPPGDEELVSVTTDDYDSNTAWSANSPPPGRGLENEHWRVWVQLAAQKNFRKTYGKIDRDLPAGTQLVFAVQSNFFVRSFDGSKAIVVAEVSSFFGSENYEMGVLFASLGALLVIIGSLFLYKAYTNPRTLGDASALDWKKK